MAQVRLGRAEILAFRRRVGALDERLPAGRRSIRQAAWAGLQDSMPRAALLSIHARVAGTRPDSWADPSLIQVWGPRYQVYVIAERDLAVFTPCSVADACVTGTRATRSACTGTRCATPRSRAGWSSAGRARGSPSSG